MKDHYQPFLIGSQFRVLPPDCPVPQDDKINLLMERGAFGSGEHETTDSCLKCLEQLPLSGNEKILDLGSGTGILALAALRLGGGHVWCIDIDAGAVQTCRTNCRLNQLGPQVDHLCGTLDDLTTGDFDLVLANIYGDILLQVAKQLVEKTRSGGLLLLSGILWEYNFDVRQTYARLGCEVLENRMLSEFSTVLLKKT